MKFLTMKFSNQNYVAKFSTIKFSKVKFLTIKFLTMKFSNQNYVAKFSTVQISTIKFSTIKFLTMKFSTMKFSNQNIVAKSQQSSSQSHQVLHRGLRTAAASLLCCSPQPEPGLKTKIQSFEHFLLYKHAGSETFSTL